jgi:type VI secretion system protein
VTNVSSRTHLPLLIPVLAFMTACSVLKPVRTAAHLNSHLLLSVNIDQNLNQDTPLAVDVIAVSNKNTAKDISSLTSRKWFATRTALERMHPSDLHVYSWEWIPGQQVADLTIPKTEVAAGLFLFADYSSSGSHTAVLPKTGNITVTFGQDDFSLPGNH